MNSHTSNTQSNENYESAINQAYAYANNLLEKEGLKGKEVSNRLVKGGMQENEAQLLVQKIQVHIKMTREKQSKRDMLFGTLWFIGGAITSSAGLGYVFWIATAFGLFLFLKGLYKL